MLPSQCKDSLFGPICKAVSSGLIFVRPCDKAIYEYPDNSKHRAKRVCIYFEKDPKYNIPKCRYNKR